MSGAVSFSAPNRKAGTVLCSASCVHRSMLSPFWDAGTINSHMIRTCTPASTGTHTCAPARACTRITLPEVVNQRCNSCTRKRPQDTSPAQPSPDWMALYRDRHRAERAARWKLAAKTKFVWLVCPFLGCSLTLKSEFTLKVGRDCCHKCRTERHRICLFSNVSSFLFFSCAKWFSLDNILMR